MILHGNSSSDSESTDKLVVVEGPSGTPTSAVEGPSGTPVGKAGKKSRHRCGSKKRWTQLEKHEYEVAMKRNEELAAQAVIDRNASLQEHSYKSAKEVVVGGQMFVDIEWEPSRESIGSMFGQGEYIVDHPTNFPSFAGMKTNEVEKKLSEEYEKFVHIPKTEEEIKMIVGNQFQQKIKEVEDSYDVVDKTE
jgi:hypothetical protein